jgi:Leucine-rich repeat (LRR) protein
MRKNTVSTAKEQVQADTNVPVKPEINNSVEHEDKPIEAIIPDRPAETAKVGITLKYTSSKYDRIVYVDQNAAELEFFKVSIIGIEGLSQLKFLETIVFNKASDLHDYSFLTDVPQLKRLFIDWVTKNVDWSFIEQLPELEVLYVESYHLYENGSYRQPAISIDLRNNKHLEYIGFKGGLLETFPVLLNIPDSLIYLNLESNKITSLPTDFMPNSIKYLNLIINRIETIPLDLNAFKNAIIFLQSNPVKADATLPGNIVMESEVYEEKYRIPYNIRSISDIRY